VTPVFYRNCRAGAAVAPLWRAKSALWRVEKAGLPRRSDAKAGLPRRSDAKAGRTQRTQKSGLCDLCDLCG